MYINQNDILYFISNGLTISGLLIASITGSKVSDKEIINGVYRAPNSPFTIFRGEEVIISPEDIREQKIKEAVQEKVKFVFCFVFTFVGILLEVLFSFDIPDGLLLRILGTVVSVFVFSVICVGINRIYAEKKVKKIVDKIKKGYALDVQVGDVII